MKKSNAPASVENILSADLLAELRALGIDFSPVLATAGGKLPLVFHNVFMSVLREPPEGKTRAPWKMVIDAASEVFSKADGVLRDQFAKNTLVTAEGIKMLRSVVSPSFITTIESARTRHVTNYGEAIKTFLEAASAAVSLIAVAYGDASASKYISTQNPADKDVDSFSPEARMAFNAYLKKFDACAARYFRLELSFLDVLLLLHAGGAIAKGEVKKAEAILACRQRSWNEAIKYLNSKLVAPSKEAEDEPLDARAQALLAPTTKFFNHLRGFALQSGQSGNGFINSIDLGRHFVLDPARTIEEDKWLTRIISELALLLSQNVDVSVILRTFTPEIDLACGVQVKEIRGYRLGLSPEGELECKSMAKEVLQINYDDTDLESGSAHSSIYLQDWPINL